MLVERSIHTFSLSSRKHATITAELVSVCVSESYLRLQLENFRSNTTGHDPRAFEYMEEFEEALSSCNRMEDIDAIVDTSIE